MGARGRPPQVKREYEILAGVSHSHIVRALGSWDDDKHLYVASELGERGDLLDIAGERLTARMFRERLDSGLRHFFSIQTHTHCPALAARFRRSCIPERAVALKVRSDFILCRSPSRSAG